MCGRFTLSVPPEVLAEVLGLEHIPALAPRYNIAPTQEVAVVTGTAEGGRSLSLARWGLVPAGARDLRVGAKMINARQETLFELPAFRRAAKLSRCLVPADGFYEWRKDPDNPKKKLPYHLRTRDGRFFLMAGVMERWVPPPGSDPSAAVDTVSVVTTEANATVTPIHDRMPVIIRLEDVAAWLDRSVETRGPLEHLFRPLAAELIVVEPVSTHVNDVGHDDPGCLAPRIEPAEPARRRQLGFNFG